MYPTQASPLLTSKWTTKVTDKARAALEEKEATKKRKKGSTKDGPATKKACRDDHTTDQVPDLQEAVQDEEEEAAEEIIEIGSNTGTPSLSAEDTLSTWSCSLVDPVNSLQERQ